ncbi:MAG: UDP-glucose 4-epimerase GalE [Thermodesulfovibrionales bacterium]
MILIVGGAGYIGSHTNKLLREKGYGTAVFDNLVHGHREFVRGGEFILGDLSDREQVRLCFARHPIEAVMHFGAFAYVGESVADPAKYYRNNVANTLVLLEAMREYGVRRFVFSSTCAVYGHAETMPLTEEHPPRPINPYGRGKLMVEEILGDYDRAYGINYVSLRYFNAAGADPGGELGERHLPETHLIPLTMQAALGMRERVVIYGTDYPTPDGTCIRDYIHVTDLAEAHCKALEYLKRTGQSAVCNLGTGKGASVREIISRVKEASGKDFPVEEAGRRAGDPPVLVADYRKAQDLLDWRPERGMAEIIRTAWAWHSRERAKKRDREENH